MTIDELILHFQAAKPAATDAQILRLEKGLQAKLPSDYRSLLVLRNGGNLNEQLVAAFPSEHHANGYGNAIVERVFSVGDRGETAVKSVATHFAEIEHLPEDVPEQMICIADDYSGNVITLDLRPATYGQIGLIDHELIGERFDDPEGYQVVAPTFSTFVANLKDAAPEPPTAVDESEAVPSRWTGDNNEGLWVMLVGLALALIVLAWLA